MRLITFFVLLNSLNSFGQEITDNKFTSVGGYVMVLPTSYDPEIFLGGLLDLSFKNEERLCWSSSINYYATFYESYFHNISATSGLSWTLQKYSICFRPGIQLGYLNKKNTHPYYRNDFNGILGRVSTELSYVYKKMEFGFHINVGIAFGQLKYKYWDIQQSNYIEYTGGLGFAFKYRISKSVKK